MLGLAVQPPSRARPGVELYPPVAVRLSSDTNIYEQLSQIWAVASLVHKSGEVVDFAQLGGSVTDSAHPLPDSSGVSGRTDRAYFYFPNLKIPGSGRYRIRITLMQMEYPGGTASEGQVRICEYVDSRTITVEDGASNHARPDGQERAFIRVLKNDGQKISSAPV